MNNNFENENNNTPEFGFEPQKPFTDKTNPNPVEFRRPAEPIEDDPVQEEVFEQPIQTPFESQPVHNDYSQPVYQNSYYNQQQLYQHYNEPVQNMQSPQSVPNMPYPNQQYRSNIPPYQPIPPIPPQPQQPPAKANAGLIAIIAVLSVLLVSSFIGILVHITSNAPKSSNSDNNNAFNFTIPEYDYTIPQTEEETSPTATHDDTDYSDKIIPNFKGISLQDKPKDASTNKAYTAETAFDKASDSVVGVVCYSDKVTNVEDCDSQGSGIIITSDGYVVTNAHVIGNSKTAYIIQVVTADGKTYNAGVVGYDTRTDIAVLKMDGAQALKAASFGDSAKITLGEDIIAIGNPGGLDYQNSITKGIVSAVNRELSSTSLVKYIQTDAAINPGNSGGPIVNMYGQVIGIATSKIVSEQFEGMGFAIPSSDVKTVADSLIKNGYVAGRVKIGITGYAVDTATATAYGYPSGILVQDISTDGPCANTELKSEDIITELDGQSIASFSDIYSVLEQHKPGDKVKLKYFRPSSEKYGEIEITLQEDIL